MLRRRRGVIPAMTSVSRAVQRVARKGHSVDEFKSKRVLLADPSGSVNFRRNSPLLTGHLQRILIDRRRKRLITVPSMFDKLGHCEHGYHQFRQARFFVCNG